MGESLLLLCVSFESLYALALGNNHRNAFVFNLLTHDAFDFLHVLWQGNDNVQVVAFYAQGQADGFVLMSSGRVLSARHGSGQVVANDDGDGSVVVDGIQQTRHA